MAGEDASSVSGAFQVVDEAERAASVPDWTTAGAGRGTAAIVTDTAELGGSVPRDKVGRDPILDIAAAGEAVQAIALAQNIATAGDALSLNVLVPDTAERSGAPSAEDSNEDKKGRREKKERSRGKLRAVPNDGNGESNYKGNREQDKGEKSDPGRSGKLAKVRGFWGKKESDGKPVPITSKRGDDKKAGRIHLPTDGSGLPSLKTGVPEETPGRTEPVEAPAAAPSLIGRTASLVRSVVAKLLLLALLLGPTLGAAYYYLFVAVDRYEVSTKFLVRVSGMDAPTTTTSVLGQPQSFGRTIDESYSVVDYVTSYDGMIRLDKLFDLRKAYSYPKDDPFYYLPADSSSLELFDYYLSMIDAHYDLTTGLVNIAVRAFTPQDALAIANAIMTEGERLVNEFNTRSERDLLKLARSEVSVALRNLESAERELTEFRRTNNVIDPMEVIARVNGIIRGLEGEISRTEAELHQLSTVTGNRGGVARRELEARITSLKAQVVRERERLVGQQESMGNLIPEFELLSLRKELAGQAYSASLASLQNALGQAQRQQLYLVPVVAPTELDQPQLPDRWNNIFFVILATVLLLTIGRLLYMGIRDHIL